MNMRIGVVFVSIILVGNLFGQSEHLTIENLEGNILYRGHNNILKVALFNDSEISVTCAECDTIYERSEKSNEYVVRPGRNFEVDLEVVSRSDSQQIKQLRKYHVLNLPKPIVYFGGVTSNNPYPFSTIPVDLNVKYESSVRIYETFEIKKWVVCSKKKCFKGKGDQITSETQEYLDNLKREEQIQISVTYMGSDQIQRLVTGYYLIGSKKIRKSQNQPKHVILD